MGLGKLLIGEKQQHPGNISHTYMGWNASKCEYFVNPGAHDGVKD